MEVVITYKDIPFTKEDLVGILKYNTCDVKYVYSVNRKNHFICSAQNYMFHIDYMTNRGYHNTFVLFESDVPYIKEK